MVNHLCPGLPCPWWLAMFGVERGEADEDEAEEEREGGERMGLRCCRPLRFSRRLMSRPLKRAALIYNGPLLLYRMQHLKKYIDLYKMDIK